MKPFVLWCLAPLLVLVAGFFLVAVWLASRAEPEYEGTLVLGALSAPVQVDYGPHVIPSVRADNLVDLLTAQGYLTAAERMWQMDLMRRVARGRLAEVFGERALPLDRLMRTLGLERAAEGHLAALPPATRKLLEAYAAGVNAYRARAESRPPLEYLLLAVSPAPWSALDSLAIAQYMTYLLSFNVRDELAYLRLAERVGWDKAGELFPADEGIPIGPVPPELDDVQLAIHDPFLAADRLSEHFGLPRPAPASNAWALDGTRTADGAPILANDPHLLASMPNIWFEQELIAPALHVSGASIAGLPLVLIGHNEHLAWGLTTSTADTQDLVIERPIAKGGAVLRADGTETIRERWEAIAVRGGAAQRLRVRWTSNGVILNDVFADEQDPRLGFTAYLGPDLLALRQTTGLPDTAFEGLFRLNRAATLTEARRAVDLIAHASQNVLVAHRDGGIAWQVSGRLPIRERGNGGLPVPGWIAGYEWLGYVPPRANPYWTDPADGQLVSANQRSVPADHAIHVSNSWLAPYRAQRIEELLGRRQGLSLEDMRAIQMDRVGVEVHYYQRTLSALQDDLQRIDPRVWPDAERLIAWDGVFHPDSEPAVLFVLLRETLLDALLADELGPELEAYKRIAVLSYNGLQETVRSGRSSFWDDISTPDTEQPAHIWARALGMARAELDRRGDATLGDFRPMLFPHAFSNMPLVGHLFSVGPVPSGGDNHTLDVRKAHAGSPDRPVFIPSYRVLFSPGDWEASRSVQPLGQSGHRFSPYRSDQLADWLAGRYHRLVWNGHGPDALLGRLRLLPAPAPASAR